MKGIRAKATRAKAIRWVLLAAALVLAAYFGAEPMFDVVIRQMLYPAPSVRVPSPPPSPLEEVALELPSGAVAVSWAYEHPKPASGGAATGGAATGIPAVLFFHGNGENLETMSYAGLYELLAGLGVHFLAVDYPGYGRSTGRPSEASLTAAGEAGFEWLERRYPDQPKIVLGWSLGAAVAIRIAASHAAEVAGLALLSAWDDLESLGSVHFPKWLVRAGLSDRYDSRAAVARLLDGGHRPLVVMIHGEDDRLIPIAHGRRLHEAFGDAARFVAVPGTGHNDLLSRQVVWEELGALFREVGAGA